MASLKTPLLGAAMDPEADAKPGPPKPPATGLLVVAAVSAVLASTSGMALMTCWRDARWALLAWVLPAHIAALSLAGLVWARRLVPRVRAWADALDADDAALAAAGLADAAKAPSYDPRWDTVKWTLTTMVAVTHFTDALNGYAPREIYGCWKEFFLMESYAFVSGYLSSPEPTPRRLRAVWKSVAGAYAIHQSLLMLTLKLGFVWLAATWVPGRLYDTYSEMSYADARSINVVEMFWYPYGPMYYLMNLVMWRLAAPFWFELRYPLAVACACSVVYKYGSLSPKATYEQGSPFMSIGTFWGYLPFYVLGVVLRRHGARLRAALAWPGARAAARAAMLTLLALVTIDVAGVNGLKLSSLSWFATVSTDTCLFANNGNDSYSYYDSDYHGWPLRLAFYESVAGFPLRVVAILSVFVLWSSDEPVVLDLGAWCGCGGWLPRLDVTRAGKYSIVNYVMHYYVKYALAFTPLLLSSNYTRPWGPLWAVGLVAIAVAQANLWMHEPVAKLVSKWLIFPDMESGSHSLLRPAPGAAPTNTV